VAVTLNSDLEKLRGAIQDEYAEVATRPDKGFHFHTGRPLARMLSYPEAETDPLPDTVVEPFAGLGNPFAFGPLRPGETAVDLGSGAGFDALLAARQVDPTGRVIGVDTTPAMLEKARANAATLGLENLEFRRGHPEEVPIEGTAVDAVISNGVINLSPDKEAVFGEVARVLKPGGRIQVAASVVRQAVPDAAKGTSTSGPAWDDRRRRR
jgi:arsenite methyltransferase